METITEILAKVEREYENQRCIQAALNHEKEKGTTIELKKLEKILNAEIKHEDLKHNGTGSGGLMQLVAWGKENEYFSSDKYCPITAGKALMTPVNAHMDEKEIILKSDISVYSDAFYLDSIYYEKVKPNATMLDPTIFIQNAHLEYKNLKDYPTHIDTSGSYTFTIGVPVVRYVGNDATQRQNIIFVNYVPGYNAYVVGRLHFFDTENRKKILATDSAITYEQAISTDDAKYMNDQKYHFSPDSPCTLVGTDSVNNFAGQTLYERIPGTQQFKSVMSYNKINLTCTDADVIQVDTIRVKKSEEETKNLTIQIGEYNIPLNLLQKIPQYCVEDDEYYTFTIPSWLIGYIPIFYTKNHLTIKTINNIAVEIHYSKYTIEDSYKQELIGAEPTKTYFCKLYQDIKKHTDIRQSIGETEYSNLIHINIESKGLVKGFFIVSKDECLLDDIATFDLCIDGRNRISYDMYLIKKYMYRISPSVYYIPFSALNDIEKTGREAYQNALNIGKCNTLSIKMVFTHPLGKKANMNFSCYSISLNNMEYKMTTHSPTFI